MRYNEDSCSIVIPGRWNKYILTPEWIGNNIFNEEKLKVEYPINNPDLPTRYVSSEDVVFIPSIHRITFLLNSSFSTDILKKIVAMNQKILKLLSYTPILGLGINFSFQEDVGNFSHLDQFELPDNDKFLDKFFETQVTEIKREFKYDNTTLNFSIANNNTVINFNFNYHYDVLTVKEASDVLNEDILINCRDKSLNLLETIYDLKLEEEEE